MPIIAIPHPHREQRPGRRGIIFSRFLSDISNQYWEIFCYLLRVRKNENVSEEIVGRWERSFSENLPTYYHTFETAHGEALERLEQGTPDGDIDPIVRRLMAYARDTCMQTHPRE